MKRLAFCAILLICFVACEQSHQALSPASTVSAATTAQPSAAAAPAPSTSKSVPPSHKKPLIDPDSTGGVRGAQMVTFVVTADTKAAKGATVLVASTGSTVKGENITNDWGEYHTSLAPGSYRVKVNWRDRTLSQTVRIDADTQEIDLKLDTPPS
jgi:hypothetical protein